VAGHIKAGLVKIAQPAAERSQTSPLRGVLAYRAGEQPEDKPVAVGDAAGDRARPTRAYPKARYLRFSFGHILRGLQG
jgi:hypothetical protein